MSDSLEPQASLSFTVSQSLLKPHVHWVSDTIQPSHPLVPPFTFCPQSFPASQSFPMYWLLPDTLAGASHPLLSTTSDPICTMMIFTSTSPGCDDDEREFIGGFSTITSDEIIEWKYGRTCWGRQRPTLWTSSAFQRTMIQPSLPFVERWATS